MKTLSAILISALGVLAALPAFAAKQEQGAASPAPTPPAAQQAEDVSTSGRNWTAQDGVDLIPPESLQRQGVVTWGAATQPGPRNEHATPPHGAPLAAGDRSNVPGRE
jgi:hypothetical protein